MRILQECVITPNYDVIREHMWVEMDPAGTQTFHMERERFNNAKYSDWCEYSSDEDQYDYFSPEYCD